MINFMGEEKRKETGPIDFSSKEKTCSVFNFDIPAEMFLGMCYQNLTGLESVRNKRTDVTYLIKTIVSDDKEQPTLLGFKLEARLNEES
tara:strand:+ start:297 stop:563 length:267 start_codon:yes stop_codon:yes gene_type:complete